MININSYIDFYKLFNDLCSIHKSDLNEYRYEAIHYDKLLKFIESIGFNKWELIKEECELSNSHIFWIFSYDFQDANESNPQSTTAEYCITFDRFLDEFTSVVYEQG